MRNMTDVGGSSAVVAGPLRVTVAADGGLRIGCGEPDWFGPAHLITPEVAIAPRIASTANRVTVESNGIVASIDAVVDEPVVVLRLEASAARRGIATGDFATPSVAWHFEPLER